MKYKIEFYSKFTNMPWYACTHNIIVCATIYQIYKFHHWQLINFITEAYLSLGENIIPPLRVFWAKLCTFSSVTNLISASRISAYLS